LLVLQTKQFHLSLENGFCFEAMTGGAFATACLTCYEGKAAGDELREQVLQG
jgi:hypothetical protein